MELLRTSKALSLSFLEKLTRFVYPPFCLGCNDFLAQDLKLLCDRCLEESDLLPVSERCDRCLQENKDGHHCPPSSLNRLFGCLPDSPLARRLLPHSSIFTAFMLYQWAQLHWEKPDLLMITAGNRQVDSLYKTRLAIAKELSLLWNIPLHPTIEINQELLEDPFVSLEEQTPTSNLQPYKVIKPHLLVNKHILLIHDICRTKNALNITAKVLQKYGASRIDGLCAIFEET
jgi:predicted amidophosphoribosyltransferase